MFTFPKHIKDNVIFASSCHLKLSLILYFILFLILSAFPSVLVHES